MTLSLPRPGPQYSQDDEAQMRHAVETADRANVKVGASILIDPDRNMLVIKSPDGSRWNITIANDGMISGAKL